MNLFFSGHDERYAVEQTLLTLFPDERPVYPDHDDPAADALDLRFSVGPRWATATAVLRRGGAVYRRQARVASDRLPEDDPVLATRLRRRTLQRAFYWAAVDALGAEPPWGMLSGVRPVKLPARAMAAGATAAQAARELRETYRVSPERCRLALDCAQASLDVQRSLRPEEISLYVGIPFCPTRCAYCSFISAAGQANRLIPDYLAALLQELDAAGRAVRAAGRTVRTIYVGGGTPTTLSADQLAALLARLRAAFPLVPGAECTVEAGRPDTISREKLLAIRDGGGTRISINPQTLSDDVLARIGRSHRAEDVVRAYDLARDVGGLAVNMDLIAGLPGDDRAGFAETLRRVRAMGPENVTVHTLALKRGARLRQEDQDRPDGAAVRQMLDAAWSDLRADGYVPYYLYRQKFTAGALENVGWCLPGTRNEYNICMMEELHPVLSLGAGGVTKAVGAGCVRRLANPKYPQEYLRDLPRILREKEQLATFLTP